MPIDRSQLSAPRRPLRGQSGPSKRQNRSPLDDRYWNKADLPGGAFIESYRNLWADYLPAPAEKGVDGGVEILETPFGPVVLDAGGVLQSFLGDGLRRVRQVRRVDWCKMVGALGGK
jgi:hypothetical protein